MKLRHALLRSAVATSHHEGRVYIACYNPEVDDVVRIASYSDEWLGIQPPVSECTAVVEIALPPDMDWQPEMRP